MLFLVFCPLSIRAVWRGEMRTGQSKTIFAGGKDSLCPGSCFKTAGILHLPCRRVREERAVDFFGVLKEKTCVHLSIDTGVMFELVRTHDKPLGENLRSAYRLSGVCRYLATSASRLWASLPIGREWSTVAHS